LIDPAGTTRLDAAHNGIKWFRSRDDQPVQMVWHHDPGQCFSVMIGLSDAQFVHHQAGGIPVIEERMAIPGD